MHVTRQALITGPKYTPLWAKFPARQSDGRDCKLSSFDSIVQLNLSDTIMSRQPSQAQRPLSLTEELEKLEQSITLTMQGKVKK